MRFLLSGLALMLAACSPALNWRVVRVESLSALLPCKPDHGTRVVPFDGKDVTVTMAGCDADGATFAIAVAQMGSSARATEMMQAWKLATLANMRATGSSEKPLQVPGALQVAGSARVTATGQRADGRRVEGQATYFVQGGQSFQAVIYADKLAPDAADTFFSSLKFQ